VGEPVPGTPVDATTTTVVDGTSEYDLPTDVLDITRMAHKGIKLRRVSKFELDSLYQSDWSTLSGTPASYYVDLDPNNKKFRLYPIPGGTDAGVNLAIEYIKIPPELTNDGAVPWDGHTLMAPYHMAIAYWASADLLKQNPDAARAAKINVFEKEYEKMVDHCIETFRALAQTSPLRMRGGRYFQGVS